MFCGGAVIVVVVIAGGEWVVDESWKLVGFCEGAEVDWERLAVLGREAVPGESPLDKVPMVWRLMQLLPG